MTAREEYVERLKQQVAMAHLCTGGDLARWQQMEADSPPEYIAMLEEAALDEDLRTFITSLHGIKF